MLRVENLSKSYGHQVLFEEVGFFLNPGERLGLVGRNGSGKTTLFRILLGEEAADEGSVSTPPGYRMGHLSQHLDFRRETILEEVLQGLGDEEETESYRAEAALMGLGFSKEDLSLPACRFSGGYQIRIDLARVLASEPDLLLLDEPTNYLDIVSVRWLERFLRAWRNEMILITHDRRFLERVTTHTMAIHRQRVRKMEGSAEKLFTQIAIEEEVHESTRANEAKKRQHEERFIERFRYKASKAKAVQSRIKALEKREQLEELGNERDLSFHFDAAPFQAARMIRVDGLEFAYPGGPTLIEDLSFEVAKGEHIGIVGKNGKGKSTLLGLLAGELEPVTGSLQLNPNTAIAYFGQTNIDRLHPEHTVEEELFSAAPKSTTGAIRSLAGLLMFSGEAALKPVRVLSGGERSRVLLGKLLLSPANLLLLDEPTNHLDAESIEGLLEAVEEFPGSVLFVTHSEMILERLATRLIVFDRGCATLFEGTYPEFLERVGWQDEEDAEGAATSRKPAARLSAKDARRRRAELVTARAKVTGPLKQRIASLEKRIETLEAEVGEHDREMERAAGTGDHAGLAQLASRASAKRKEIDERFDELEREMGALEAARAEFDAKLEEIGEG